MNQMGFMEIFSFKMRRERQKKEIKRDFFLKVHLGDSNRQPQSSRENLE